MADNDEEWPEGTSADVRSSDTPGTRFTLALASLRHALGPKELKLGAGLSGIVIVAVPSETWLDDIASASREVWSGFEVHVLRRRTSSRDENAQDLLVTAARGNGIVLVTATLYPSVPEPLILAARLVLRVAMPRRDELLKIVRSIVTGRVDRAFRSVAIERLDFDTFCACIVPGVSARYSAFRVATALARDNVSTGRHGVPDLRDAVGYPGAKEWARALVADVALYREGNLPWSEVDSGAVLWGPPGTGKTLFGRIVAKAAGMPLIITSVAEYFASGTGYLESVIRHQRGAFDRAVTAAPSILFIDELDALPARGTAGHNDGYWAPVVTDLLTLLDSAMFDRTGVVVIAATNRLSSIDPALLRSGRLGTHLHIGAPDPTGFEAILRFHLKGELADCDLFPLANENEGATGADAARWVGAARRRARLEDRLLASDDLAEVMRKAHARPAMEDYRIAVHEAGHVLVALACGLSVSSATIIGKGGNSGTTRFVPAGRSLHTKSEVEAIVTAILGGRAAEAVFFAGEPSSAAGGGPDSDLAQATMRVTEWHATLGMGAGLTWHGGGFGPFDGVARSAVEADLQRLFLEAICIVESRKETVEALARRLLERRTIGSEEAEALFVARDR